MATLCYPTAAPSVTSTCINKRHARGFPVKEAVYLVARRFLGSYRCRKGICTLKNRGQPIHVCLSALFSLPLAPQLYRVVGRSTSCVQRQPTPIRHSTRYTMQPPLAERARRKAKKSPTPLSRCFAERKIGKTKSTVSLPHTHRRGTPSITGGIATRTTVIFEKKNSSMHEAKYGLNCLFSIGPMHNANIPCFTANRTPPNSRATAASPTDRLTSFLCTLTSISLR